MDGKNQMSIIGLKKWMKEPDVDENSFEWDEKLVYIQNLDGCINI